MREGADGAVPRLHILAHRNVWLGWAADIIDIGRRADLPSLMQG